MKNEILYYYKLDPMSIHQKNKNYYFTASEINYCLMYLEDIKLLDKFNEIKRHINTSNLPFHQIVLNIDNKEYTAINQNLYVLLKIRVVKKTINIEDILKINSVYMYEIKSVDLGKLWSEKIDFFEYQLNQMGKEYKLIIQSFSYFIGLAETAILLYNTTEKTNVVYSLNHKRITYQSTTYDLYNPFNVIGDIRIRDVCDYINSCFFSNKDAYGLIGAFVKNNFFSKEEKNLILTRILFPTYYFDLYEKIINKNIEEQEINKILDKITDYEKFILYVYQILNTNNEMANVEWIKKIMQH